MGLLVLLVPSVAVQCVALPWVSGAEKLPCQVEPFGEPEEVDDPETGTSSMPAVNIFSTSFGKEGCLITHLGMEGTAPMVEGTDNDAHTGTWSEQKKRSSAFAQTPP